MSLNDTLSQCYDKILKEFEIFEKAADAYFKYKDMSPEEIAAPANLQQAVKDRAAIDGMAKSINASIATAKKLGMLTQDLDKTLVGQAQSMSLTLIKLNSVNELAKKMKVAMNQSLAQLNSAEQDMNMMEAIRLKEAHVAQLFAEATSLQQTDEITGKILYALANEPGTPWQLMGNKISEAKILLMKMRSIIKEATPG